MQRVRSSDGVDLAAYHLGGGGPPLLLAHATGFHAHVWLPVVEHLKSAFSCWAFDERGHGDSTSPPAVDPDDPESAANLAAWNWHRSAADALAVVDAVGLERPFAAGHSAGGALLLMAEQERPGCFRSLYCFEPIVMPVEPPPGPDRSSGVYQSAIRRREVFPSREAAYDNYAAKPPFSSLDPQALRAYVDFGFDDLPDGSVRLKCRSADEAKVYLGGTTHRAYAGLGGVHCPTTIACGALSTTIGPETAEAQASRIPHARVQVFDELGHFGPLEDPGTVAEAIATAFARSGG